MELYFIRDNQVDWALLTMNLSEVEMVSKVDKRLFLEY